MGGSVRSISGGVKHAWEHLSSSLRVDGGSNKLDVRGSTTTDRVIVIQVSLWGIDVSKVEWTGACWMVKIEEVYRERGAERGVRRRKKKSVTLEKGEKKRTSTVRRRVVSAF